MRKQLIYALVLLGLLVPLISCQTETVSEDTARAEVTVVIQEEAPVPTTQRLADGERSASGLNARLEVPATLTLGEPVKVHFSLANDTSDNVYLLNWFTALEGLGGDIFRVTRDVQRVRYQGPLASRGDPTPEAYTLIEAGGTAQAEVDLSLAYDFSIPGKYTIEFVSPSISHVARSEAEMAQSLDELGPVEIPSNKVVVTIAVGSD